MKHKTLFRFCSFLFLIGIIFALATFGNKPDLEDADSYNIYNDLPVIRASSAAYLLDADFTVTPKNFADCAEDYFSAPAMLYFDIGYYPEPTWAIKDPEKAAAFADAFRDISLTPISEEYFPPSYDHSKWYSFVNAIGHFSLYEQNGITYIRFSRDNDFVRDTATFSLEGNLVSEARSIGNGLKPYAKECPDFEMPH